MYCKDRQRYDSSRYQRKRMPEIKEKLSISTAKNDILQADKNTEVQEDEMPILWK